MNFLYSLIFIFSVVILILVFTHTLNSSFIIHVETEQDILDSCKNLNLHLTSKCLVENVKTIYKYHETDDSMILSFNSLKEQGGDCRDYSLLYSSLGNKLGFQSSKLHLDLTTKQHAVAFITDGKDYCILDQTSYWCKELQ